MNYEAERKQLNDYIKQFDTAEFSSTNGSMADSGQDVEQCRQRIQRYRAKLERKRKMQQSLQQTLDKDGIVEDKSVIITQQQIDALLAAAGL